MAACRYLFSLLSVRLGLAFYLDAESANRSFDGVPLLLAGSLARLKIPDCQAVRDVLTD